MKSWIIVSAVAALAHGGNLGLSRSHHAAAIVIPTRVSYGGGVHSAGAPVAYAAQSFSSQPVYLSAGSSGGFAAGGSSIGIGGIGGGGIGGGGGSFGSRPRLHEIHTHSGRQLIRLEEYQGPNQIIRVHEQPQGPPQIIKVAAPAEAPSVIRVVAKSSGRAHIERVVHRLPGPQVFDIKKPARAPARIIQVVRAQAPAPRIEFIQEPENDHQIYVAHAPAPVPLPPPGAGTGISAGDFESAPANPFATHGEGFDEDHYFGSHQNFYSQQQHSHEQIADEFDDGNGIIEPRAALPVPTRSLHRSRGW